MTEEIWEQALEKRSFSVARPSVGSDKKNVETEPLCVCFCPPDKVSDVFRSGPAS